ncbi:MAG TPA: hypothetical protein VFK02_16365 [Kofleriaceae bacterium]|nr:hypothetical protein [Kofleriaceae bacterium]
MKARRSHGLRSIAATSVAIGCLTATAPAGAQSAEAEGLFNDGNKLMAQGQIAAACDAFEASNHIEPRAGTLIRLGECREQNHQLASAWSAYKDALTRVKDPKKRAYATARAAALEPRISRLTVAVPAESRIEGLALTRGGKPLDPVLWNRALTVDGGDYVITARARGREDWRATAHVAIESDKVAIDVPRLKELSLPAARPAEPPASSAAQPAPSPATSPAHLPSASRTSSPVASRAPSPPAPRPQPTPGPSPATSPSSASVSRTTSPAAGELSPASSPGAGPSSPPPGALAPGAPPAGAAAGVYAPTTAEVDSRPHGLTPRRKGALVVGAVAVAAAITGVAFGVSSRAKKDDAFKKCPEPSAPCAAADQANALLESSRSRALGANLALGFAAVATIGAAVLYFTGSADRAGPTRVGIVPSTTSGASVILEGRF